SRTDAGLDIDKATAAYRTAYGRAWADFIDDLHLRAAANNQAAVEQARLLSAPDGPLMKILSEVTTQTLPGQVPGADGPIASADPLSARFGALRSLITPDASGAMPFDRALRLFQELARLRAGGVPAADQQGGGANGTQADAGATTSDPLARVA